METLNGQVAALGSKVCKQAAQMYSSQGEQLC